MFGEPSRPALQLNRIWRLQHVEEAGSILTGKKVNAVVIMLDINQMHPVHQLKAFFHQAPSDE